MSYEIEHGKRVLSFGSKGQPYDENLLFVVSWSSNNVSPRYYSWDAVATDTFSIWNDEIQLPMQIWSMAHGADGGGIKPWDKDISGTNYIEQWKKAVRDRKPITGWTPRVAIWLKGEKAEAKKALVAQLNDPAEAVKLFGFDAEALYADFKLLFPDPIRHVEYSNNADGRVSSHDQLEAAFRLFRRRDDLPFTFYLNDYENSPFFKKKES